MLRRKIKCIHKRRALTPQPAFLYMQDNTNTDETIYVYVIHSASLIKVLKANLHRWLEPQALQQLHKPCMLPNILSLTYTVQYKYTVTSLVSHIQ